MSPEQKAQELMANFISETLRMPTLSNKQAKACAIILCDEMIENLILEVRYSEKFRDEETKQFWQQVKQSLIK